MKIQSTLYIGLLVFLQSCQFILQDNTETAPPQKNPKSNEEIVKDEDENGCLASAGYIWSKMNKECVKIYSGIQLNPASNPTNEDETKSAFILFSENGNQAEIFFPDNTETIIVSRQSEGKPWIKDDWQLIPWKGYVLKKGTEIKFTGDAELGKKISGSDVEQ